MSVHLDTANNCNALSFNTTNTRTYQVVLKNGLDSMRRIVDGSI
jgi:hypothetical protein